MKARMLQGTSRGFPLDLQGQHRHQHLHGRHDDERAVRTIGVAVEVADSTIMRAPTIAQDRAMGLSRNKPSPMAGFRPGIRRLYPQHQLLAGCRSCQGVGGTRWGCSAGWGWGWGDLDWRRLMRSGALAPTLTDSTSGGMASGSSGVVRAAVHGEGSGAKLGTASPWCAIAESASDPTLRTVQGGTAGRSCEGGSGHLPLTVPGRWVMVRRDSTR